MRWTLTLLLLTPTAADAQRFRPNYDESKVPEYTLPDPLVTQGGRKVTDAWTWREVRRPEILRLFQRHVYGKAPDQPVTPEVKQVESGDALDGKAVRKQLNLRMTGPTGKAVTLNVLIYLPKGAKGPVPAFLGLNFRGNHAVWPDPKIRTEDGWIKKSWKTPRGGQQRRWPLPLIVSRGYGLVTVYCGDIDPDFDDGFKNGVHALFPGQPKADQWGTIGAWAWGQSRVLDYLTTDGDIDAKRVAVIGHSRLGKTALWAGARDERFALVISNDSGCGGAALSRRQFGETVKRINTSFPHWFCDNFTKYNDDVASLPVDQHMLMALVAPRACYVASASKDRWADPRGEKLALEAAGPVFKLIGGQTGYHVRPGGHDIIRYDWGRYLDFADRCLARR